MSSLDRYRTFGLRKPWLEGFLEKPVEWLKNNTLGPEQLKAFRRYMKDALLLDKNFKPTPLCFKLVNLYCSEPETVWQIIWLNLVLNSPLFHFYAIEVPWHSEWTKFELVSLIERKGYASRTARNAVNSLTNTFENSPLGEWFGKKIEKGKYFKSGLNSLSPFAMQYALEKLGETPEKFEKIFGMSSQDFYYNLLRL
jgi:phosphoadenosine phosphosulfate reductase